MGLTRTDTLRSKRGRELEASVADCVDAKRTPRMRQQILDGDFHRIPNPEGPGKVTVEKTFFYSDFGRRQFFLVLPRWDRHLWREASQDLREMMGHFTKSLAPSGNCTFRLVFGLAELREKLLACDAGLSDELVEVLKVLLLYDHPFLLQRPRLNLVLDRVSTEAVEFIATYDHDPERFRLGYPRQLVDELFAGREKELREWIRAVQEATSLADGEEPLWTSMQRWSPSLLALTALDQTARLIEAGAFPENGFDAPGFKLMLENLPRGPDLSAAAKRDLKVLRAWARARGQNTSEIWEVFHGKELIGEPAYLRPELVERLWDVVEGLNPEHFEGNSFVDRIHLGVDQQANYYNPSTEDITINRKTLPKGRAYEKGWFEQTVLHEIGHAVHEQHNKEVERMLRKAFGWQHLQLTPKGIDRWIAEMEGYPPRPKIKERVKRQIRSYIRKAVGEGERWSAPAMPVVPKKHLWHQKNFAPRLACECTTRRVKGKRWYDFADGWHHTGRRRFFVNYYYAELMIVNDETLDYVRKGVLDSYALMSSDEFFAELYMTVHSRDPKFVERAKQLDPDLVQYLRGLGEDASTGGNGASPGGEDTARQAGQMEVVSATPH